MRYLRSPVASRCSSMAESSRPTYRTRSGRMWTCAKPTSELPTGRWKRVAELLEVEGVEAGYGSSRILRGVSLSIARGEVVTLMGRNGMGKTTTVRSIMGLAPALAGHIRFRGHDIRG